MSKPGHASTFMQTNSAQLPTIPDNTAPANLQRTEIKNLILAWHVLWCGSDFADILILFVCIAVIPQVIYSWFLAATPITSFSFDGSPVLIAGCVVFAIQTHFVVPVMSSLSIALLAHGPVQEQNRALGQNYCY